MKLIPLTHGMIALVDDEDYERLNQYKWHSYKDGNRVYARTTILNNGRQVKVFMHRIINNPGRNEVCDHKDGDGLNNLRANIRNCSRAENGRNVKPKEGHTSKYKGVHFNKYTGKWMARITVGRKLIYLGLFVSEIDAAIHYNNKALELHGEFAKLNNIA